MSFRINKALIIWWLVTVDFPVDGGKTEPRTMMVKYQLRNKKTRDEAATKTADEAIDFALSHILDWKECDWLVNGEDQPVSFSQENLRAAMEWEFIEAALTRGWDQASRGAAVKN